MYDVAEFAKPVPYSHERNGESLQGEAQTLEFFRYERSRAPIADEIRARLNIPGTQSRQDPHRELPPGSHPGEEGESAGKSKRAAFKK